MSKVEKPSNNSANAPLADRSQLADEETFDLAAIDMSRVIDQHLDQLKRFGIRFLPGRAGHSFEFAQLSQNESESAPPAPPAKPADQSAAASAPEPQAQKSVPPAKQADPVAVVGNAVKETTASAIPPFRPKPPPRSSSNDRIGELNVIASEVAACTKCSELVECRSQTVFGVGNPNARLVLIGEAPCEQDDKLGEPFVDESGQLLDKMLAACGLNRRDDVYILNAIKCRTPANRNPKSEEIERCWSFAQRQLEILQPEFICCLGSIAARTLLQSKDSVGRLRKKFHVYRDSKVLVTYHPAYLLRTTSAKRHAWEDMQLLMNEMGIKIPDRT